MIFYLDQESLGLFTDGYYASINGGGTITFNLASLQTAGLFDASIRISDSTSSTSLNLNHGLFQISEL